MLKRIGRPPAGEPGLVDQLRECHARIRTFLDIARRLAEAQNPTTAEVAEAAAGVARYFRDAFPRHTRDEDESLAPRLRGRSGDLDAFLNRQAASHAAHEPAVKRLMRLAQTLAVTPERLEEERADLATAAREAAACLLPHLEEEEQHLLPAVEALDPDTVAAIRGEMQARRGTPVPPR